MYLSMQVYNIVFMNWSRLVLPPLLFTCCSSIVLMLYISVRPSGLPLLFHIWFPFVAAVTMSLLCWLWYDFLLIKRLADGVLESLQFKGHKFLLNLGPTERRWGLQRARALRQAPLKVGHFAEVTFEGLIDILDEIINQFLFFLSL